MKIWTSCQRAVEARVNNAIKNLAREDELAELTHRAACGTILLENIRELQAYNEYKQFRTLPEVKPAETAPDTQAQGNT